MGHKAVIVYINGMNLNRLALINISYLHVLENIPIVMIVLTRNMKHLNTQDQRNVKTVFYPTEASAKKYTKSK